MRAWYKLFECWHIPCYSSSGKSDEKENNILILEPPRHHLVFKNFSQKIPTACMTSLVLWINARVPWRTTRRQGQDFVSPSMRYIFESNRTEKSRCSKIFRCWCYGQPTYVLQRCREPTAGLYYSLVHQFCSVLCTRLTLEWNCCFVYDWHAAFDVARVTYLSTSVKMAATSSRKARIGVKNATNMMPDVRTSCS